MRQLNLGETEPMPNVSPQTTDNTDTLSSVDRAMGRLNLSVPKATGCVIVKPSAFEKHQDAVKSVKCLELVKYVPKQREKSFGGSLSLVRYDQRSLLAFQKPNKCLDLVRYESPTKRKDEIPSGSVALVVWNQPTAIDESLYEAIDSPDNFDDNSA